MPIAETVHRLLDLIRARSSTTVYLNGAPGSGKSHLLRELATRLPAEAPRTLVLGPYHITVPQAPELGALVAADIAEAGFLDELPRDAFLLDLPGVWRLFAEEAEVAADWTFVVLVDLVGGDELDLMRLARLFSSARSLEGAWTHNRVALLHVLAGYWDHPGMEEHYRSIQTSFPYTVGHNYETWQGISSEEMVRLTQRLQPSLTPLHGRMLFELTNGHPAAAVDILERIPRRADLA